MYIAREYEHGQGGQNGQRQRPSYSQSPGARPVVAVPRPFFAFVRACLGSVVDRSSRGTSGGRAFDARASPAEEVWAWPWMTGRQGEAMAQRTTHEERSEAESGKPAQPVTRCTCRSIDLQAVLPVLNPGHLPYLPRHGSIPSSTGLVSGATAYLRADCSRSVPRRATREFWAGPVWERALASLHGDAMRTCALRAFRTAREKAAGKQTGSADASRRGTQAPTDGRTGCARNRAIQDLD